LTNPESFYFGGNLDRLKNIKSIYDPNNILDSGQTGLPSTDDRCPFIVGGDPPGRRSAGVGMNENRHIYMTQILITPLVFLNNYL